MSGTGACCIPYSRGGKKELKSVKYLYLNNRIKAISHNIHAIHVKSINY